MSVILPIEIPKSCLDCPCHDGEYGVCNLTGRTIDDVRPDDCPIQEVKHGKWIVYLDDLWPEDSKQICSVCRSAQPLAMDNDNYCPNCGAKMDEEEQDGN